MPFRRRRRYRRVVRRRGLRRRSRRARFRVRGMRSSVRRLRWRRRRGVIRRRKMGIARNIVPKVKIVKLFYTESLTGAAPFDANGAPVQLTWNVRVNDMYNPNVLAGAGHQPMFSDVLQSQYRSFLVVGSKTRITFNCQGWQTNTNNDTASFNVPRIRYGGILQKATTTWPHPLTAVGQIQWRENAASVRDVSYHEVDLMYKRTPTLVRNYSAKKFWDITNIKDNLPDFSQAYNSSPPNIAYYTFAFTPTMNWVGGVANPDTVNRWFVTPTVTQTFIVMCYNPVTVPLSTI